MKIRTVNFLTSTAITAGLFSGCKVGPDYHPPTVTLLQDWGENGLEPTTRPTTQSSRIRSGILPIIDWWTTFHDPVLDSLIRRAVSDNLDLKLATARIREARAQRGVVGAGLFPQLNVSSSYQHARASENGVISAFGGSSGTAVNTGGGGQPTPGANGSPAIPGGQVTEFDLYQAGFDASWEIDVFGGVRRSTEAATADIEAAIENRRDVLMTLLGEVARNYLELREAQSRLAIAHKNLDAQRRTMELTRELARQGLTNQLDLYRAQSQVAATTAQIPSLETAVSQAIHRLSLLLGDRPTSLAGELTPASPLPHPPDEVPVGLPSELLRRRPDIRRAERQLASATARIGVATADLFPKFTLTGSIGMQSLQPGDLLSWGSRYYSLGPSVTWPIFDAGRIRGRIHVEEARQEQAILSYRSTVLSALKDVEDALVAYGKAQQRVVALRDAVQAEEKSVRIARDLYSRGLTDFLTVLDAQRTLYASEDSLATGEAAVATTLVTLYKALGGGWEIAELTSAQSPPH